LITIRQRRDPCSLLLGRTITRCAAVDAYTLGVWFDDGSCLSFHDDATNYEAFTIKSAADILVV
jgi:hypothetical protein